MSATRDSSQNSTFIYSNLYELYLKEKSREGEATGLTKGLVLKTSEPRAVSKEESEAIQNWASHGSEPGKKNLASHLLELRDARKRLSFLISEMDELLKRS